MTGKQMCEVIAFVSGGNVDPKAIWESSPTGELWHVLAMYAQAEAELASVGLRSREDFVVVGMYDKMAGKIINPSDDLAHGDFIFRPAQP